MRYGVPRGPGEHDAFLIAHFVRAAGALGFFEWKADEGVIVEPAKWMLAWGTNSTWARAETESEQGDLF